MLKKSLAFGFLAAGLMVAPGAALADVQSQNSTPKPQNPKTPKPHISRVSLKELNINIILSMESIIKTMTQDQKDKRLIKLLSRPGVGTGIFLINKGNI